MPARLLNAVSDRYQAAIAAHRELADVFWFVYMPGYAMQHEYQLIDEQQTQRRVKRYIAATYHVYARDKLPENINIADPLLRGMVRTDLKGDQVCAIIKDAFYVYKDLEEATLKEYERIASELLSNGEVSAFGFVGGIIKDVKAELVYITDKIIELCAHGWDMPQIVAEQTDYYERYSHLISKIFSENKKMSKLHHYNSSLDPETRWAESHA